MSWVSDELTAAAGRATKEIWDIVTALNILHQYSLEVETLDTPAHSDPNIPRTQPEAGIDPRRAPTIAVNYAQAAQTTRDLNFTLDDVAELDYGDGPRVVGEQVQPAAVDCGVDVRTLDRRHDTATSTQPADDAPDMLRAALWYAKQLGWYVFPLHNPLFNADGHVTGCSCELYRQSKKCRDNHPHLYLGPDGKCDNPGKCPRVRWGERSTRARSTIRKWWSHAWPDGHVPNIGIDCGKSGLLVLDADEYKNNYAGADFLTFSERETTTAITGSGGEHFIYQMPKGARYGNSTGDLPTGIDIRGTGGYIVAAPSLHKSGRRYEYEADYDPVEYPPAPLPQKLIDILETAQRTSTATNATFTVISTDRPDLTQWRLSTATIERIHAPAPRGARSEADMSVCVALTYAGADDDDILSVFEHYPIGTDGKFAERGRTYLAHTIGRARAFVADHPRAPSYDPAQIAALREWVKTNSFADYVPRELQSVVGYRTDHTDTKVADALLDACEAHRTMKPFVSSVEIARLAGLGSHQTALNALGRLEGWFCERIIDPEHPDNKCRQYRVIFVVARLATTFTTICEPVAANLATTNENGHFSERKVDDAYLLGRSRTAQLMGNTLKSLGVAGLRVIDALIDLGDCDRSELQEHTGISKSGVATATRRLEDYCIVESSRETSRAPKVYGLVPDWEMFIEQLTPEMKTYRLGAEREVKRLDSKLGYYESVGGEAWAARRAELTKNDLRDVYALLHPELSDDDQHRWVDDSERRARARAQRAAMIEHNAAAASPETMATIAPDGKVAIPSGLNRTPERRLNGRVVVTSASRANSNADHALDALPTQTFNDPSEVYDYVLAIETARPDLAPTVQRYLALMDKPALTRDELNDVDRISQRLSVPGYEWVNQATEGDRLYIEVGG